MYMFSFCVLLPIMNRHFFGAEYACQVETLVDDFLLLRKNYFHGREFIFHARKMISLQVKHMIYANA